MKKIIILLSIALVAGFAASTAISQIKLPKTKSPAGANSYIISPANGETVPATFKVQFGLEGMGIAPAGIVFENTGHHHMLVDVDDMPDFGIPLPATDNVLHYGKGQTETTLTLEPGEHTLQLVLGDHLHIPHDPPVVSKKITITVK